MFWRASSHLSSEPQWIVVTPNHAQRNFGGTLVRNAAMLHIPPTFGPESDAFAFLIGHENLHQWIPGRFGAQGGEQLNAVPNYWFSEGFTNYYTHRLLLASGVWTLERYAEAVTGVLRGYWKSPARNATAASIAPRFFSDRDAGQQMYQRGELLAMRWDRALRASTNGGPEGLDRLLKSLILPPGTGESGALAATRVVDGAKRLLGDQPLADVDAHITQGRDVPLEPDLAGPCFELGWQDLPVWVPGFDTGSIADRRIRGVTPGGPAFAAGLRDGMALLGWSIYGSDIERDIELTVEVDGIQRKLAYRPVDGTRVRQPGLSVRPGAAADASCRSWQRTVS